MMRRSKFKPHFRLYRVWNRGDYDECAVRLLHCLDNGNFLVCEWIIGNANEANPVIRRVNKYSPADIPSEYDSVTAQDLMDWTDYHTATQSKKDTARLNSIADRIWRERNWDENFFHN